ncbi:MAG: hypothetical protein ACFFCJ_07905, partial [Promethearchaeota archaeon]
MSFVLGVVGVFVLCLVAIVLVPGFIETFEDMIYYLFPPKSKEITTNQIPENHNMPVISEVKKRSFPPSQSF